MIFIDIHERLCNRYVYNGKPALPLIFRREWRAISNRNKSRFKPCLSWGGFIVNRDNRIDHLFQKLNRNYSCVYKRCKNLPAYISTMEKAKALHKSARYILIIRTYGLNPVCFDYRINNAGLKKYRELNVYCINIFSCEKFFCEKYFNGK